MPLISATDQSYQVSAGLPGTAGEQVLCMEEGEGRNAVHLAQLGHRMLAQDLSAVAGQGRCAGAEQRRNDPNLLQQSGGVPSHPAAGDLGKPRGGCTLAGLLLCA